MSWRRVSRTLVLRPAPLTRQQELHWSCLPAEIQTYIVEALIQHGHVARYASVCRAWQIIVERRLFASLKVTKERLRGLSEVAYAKRHLVKEIWFSVEPEPHGYPCGTCGTLVRVPGWHQVSPDAIRSAVRDLVTELSTWEGVAGVVLDVSVRPPSALLHETSIVRYGPPVIEQKKQEEEVSVSCEDRMHNIANSQVEMYLYSKTRRPVQEPELTSRVEMPTARCVTRLVLRRQTRAAWTSDVLQEMMHMLPEVQEVQYEPWREWRRMEHWPTSTPTMRLCTSLRGHDRLKRLTIFEDFHGNNRSMPDAVQAAQVDTARALVTASFGLEHLSASFACDASHFFDLCTKMPTDRVAFPRLESLALTASTLDPQEKSRNISDYLVMVAQVVRSHIPRLKLMELWNGGAEFAAVFRYQIPTLDRSAAAKTTWCGSWDVPQTSSVQSAWQDVASEQTGRSQLDVVTEILDSVMIESHADAICALGMRNQVMHPVSLWQMQSETKSRSARWEQ